MCVIISAETGIMPTTLQLALMSETNPDGAGIAWHDGKRLHRYRNTDNDQTLAFILTHRDMLEECPFILHFRLATHGAITTENTHPFAWRKNHSKGFICHNGIARPYTKGRYASDSRNAIQAWQEGTETLQDPRLGTFTSIDQTGRIQWSQPPTPITADGGTIHVSNTNWLGITPTPISEDELFAMWEEGYQTALNDYAPIQ